jgi:hypothetical protein
MQFGVWSIVPELMPSNAEKLNGPSIRLTQTANFTAEADEIQIRAIALQDTCAMDERPDYACQTKQLS